MMDGRFDLRFAEILANQYSEDTRTLEPFEAWPLAISWVIGLAIFAGLGFVT